MPNTENDIVCALEPLVGLRLSIARDAASMKNFQFGDIRPDPSGSGTIGWYALHVQCPWRIVSDHDIMTGSGDYYEPVDEHGEVELADSKAGNLQRKRLGEMMHKFASTTRSWINATDQLVVERVTGPPFGGLELLLSGGFRLQVFPDGSRAEDWRFFSHASDEDHIVIGGGRIVEGIQSGETCNGKE